MEVPDNAEEAMDAEGRDEEALAEAEGLLGAQLAVVRQAQTGLAGANKGTPEAREVALREPQGSQDTVAEVGTKLGPLGNSGRSLSNRQPPRGPLRGLRE